jgi:hypothetical protein
LWEAGAYVNVMATLTDDGSAGRREPREGGFILAADGDRAEIERLAGTDPFTLGGVARYEVLEVRPTSGIPGVLDMPAHHGVSTN